MKDRIYVCLIIFIFFSSCSQKKPEFYAAPQLKLISNSQNDVTYYDVIFIKNPPQNAESLIRALDKYNQQTINKDSIESKYIYFERSFFRESKSTPRNFVPDPGGIAVDILDDHVDDYLGTYSMRKCPNSQASEWSLTSGYIKFDARYIGKKCYDNVVTPQGYPK